MRALFGLVIVAVLGLASQGTVALQWNESDPTGARTVQQPRHPPLAAALEASRPHRPIVILLSDGTDNASWLSQADAITAAKRVDVPVDLISVPRTYDTQDEDPPGSWDVEAISERTDGEAFSARDRDLSRQIAQRLTALRRRSSPVPSHSVR